MGEARSEMTKSDDLGRTYKPNLLLYPIAGVTAIGVGVFGLWMFFFVADRSQRDAGVFMSFTVFALIGVGLVWFWFTRSIRVAPEGMTITDWFGRPRTFLRDRDWATIVQQGIGDYKHLHLEFRRPNSEKKTVCVVPAYGRKAKAILSQAWGAPHGATGAYPAGARDLYLEEVIALMDALSVVKGADGERLQFQAQAAKVTEEKKPTDLRLFVPEAAPRAEAADGYIKPVMDAVDEAGNSLGRVRVTLRSGHLERLELLVAPDSDIEGFPYPDLVTYKPLKTE
jgi:hypothetical protein